MTDLYRFRIYSIGPETQGYTIGRFAGVSGRPPSERARRILGRRATVIGQFDTWDEARSAAIADTNRPGSPDNCHLVGGARDSS
jgi:hypothetical protein